MHTQSAGDVPRVYLAHASEDHDSLAKPPAERLMANGIDVWLDEWEIRPGDSLRRKMEEGLANCTHFIVLLTPTSLHKPWVETEIDVGFLRAVGGESRFIGLRAGIRVDDLSQFLRTLRCPEVRLDEADEVDALIADIYGVSRKPGRGCPPRYSKTIPEGPKGWSSAAVRVAEYLVRTSNEQDAIVIANWLISQKIEGIRIVELAPHFADWPARRLNSAPSYLDDAKLVDALKAAGSAPWVMTALQVTDRTRHVVRDHG